MLTYEIPGKPISWRRAGRNKTKYFDIQVEDKKRYRHLMGIARKGLNPLGVPLKVTLEYHMVIPASLYPKKRLELIGKYHHCVADLDNLVKFCLDAFNGILWVDDALISHIDAKKFYSEEPKTIIKIEELMNNQ